MLMRTLESVERKLALALLDNRRLNHENRKLFAEVEFLMVGSKETAALLAQVASERNEALAKLQELTGVPA